MRRRGLAILGVLAVLSVLTLLLRGRAAPPAPPTAQTSAPALSVARRPFSAPAEPQGPIIDRIEVEKTEVCEGEETLVTVRAHAPGTESNAHLHALIGGEPGMAVPIRLYRARDGSAPQPPPVVVFGRAGTATRAALPLIRVKDCRVDRRLEIAWQLQANTEAGFELSARVVDEAATTPFEPFEWHWRFGDGAEETTRQPHVMHDYGHRRQDALYSSFVLAVEARSRTGERVLGRTTLTLRNGAFVNLVDSGVVRLMVELEPRFPQLGADGFVRQTVRLWHHRPQPVRITTIVERRNFIDRDAPEFRKLPVRSMLGSAEIPAEGVTVPLTLSGAGLFSIDYLFEGASAEGLPVRGLVSIMRPPNPPTREKHVAVHDPVLVAKIIRARELLHRPFVTDEDIWALERNGAFAELSVPPSRSRPTYADLPAMPAGRPAAPPDQPLPVGEQMPVWGER